MMISAFRLRYFHSILQMQTVVKAINFAAKKHKDQRRKDANKTPYINHPIDVANILSQSGIDDPNVLAAAALHDTVQDTQTTPQELQEHFGAQIRDIVLECSDDKAKSKVERKRLQIEKAEKVSKEAKLIKTADKISNLQGMQVNPPQGWSPDRIKGYFVWSYFVCSKMIELNPHLDELTSKIFAEAGISQLSNEEKQVQLHKYLQGLEGKTD